MSPTIAFAVAALAASIYLLLRLPSRILPMLAVIASGLEVAMAFRLVTFGISGVPLPLILGGVLAVAGGWMLTQCQAKMLVVAATIVAFVGAVQVLMALRFLG